MRLAMARQFYIFSKTNKAILVLDEFEQGIDPKTIYEIINTAFKKFSNKMIIVISHLESIGINYKWDNKFKIDRIENNCTLSLDY